MARGRSRRGLLGRSRSRAVALPSTAEEPVLIDPELASGIDGVMSALRRRYARACLAMQLCDAIALATSSMLSRMSSTC